MQLNDALRRARLLLRRQATPEADCLPTNATFAGPSLPEQEPDLAKESGQYTLAASGWAAGGQPTD